MTFKDTILFTGAGFTANFGGFLAKEMWARIFNNPDLNNAGNVKLELHNNFDFEDIYSKVFDYRNPFQPNEVEIFEKVLDEAYWTMDEVVKQPEWGQSSGIHPSELRHFLDFFNEEVSGKIGACFTLNQDLFLERQYGWQPLGPNNMRYQGTFGNIDPRDMNTRTSKVLPTDQELEDFMAQLSENFYFVKLHGSLRWVAGDGSDSKVIGINKMNTIDKFPLLKWYFEIFNQAICQGNMRLIIIGYSFRDKHINDCLVQAIENHGLKLYIISTEDPQEFRFRITHKYGSRAMMNESDETGMRIWNAVIGFFPYKLNRIFPYPQRITAEKTEIYKAVGISV